jgi:hypothetical protein
MIAPVDLVGLDIDHGTEIDLREGKARCETPARSASRIEPLVALRTE